MNSPSASVSPERYAYNGERPAVESKSLDFVHEKCSLTARPHRAEFYQLLWVERGRLVLELDTLRTEVSAGQACFVGIGQVCRYDVEASFPRSASAPECPAAGRCIMFSPEYLGEISADALLLRLLAPPLSRPKVHMLRDAAQFSVVFGNLQTELRRPAHPLQRVVVQSYLRVLLSALADEEEAKTAADERANLARDFIAAVEHRFCEWSTVADYLRLLAVGEKVLSAAVRHTTGYTPKAYIDRRRTLEAKRMLIYTQRSAKEIAYALGFDEPTNFQKFFRKHVGETPQTFRARYAEN